jgi:arsenite methyltransferase
MTLNDRSPVRSAAPPATTGGGPSAYGSSTRYPAGLADSLPFDMAAFSLGCGDPIGLAGLQSGDVVVDLGSGGGMDCFMAARLVGPRGRIIGVVTTSALLARANTQRARLNVANVEFRRGSIEALPVAAGEATVIICNCFIHLSSDKPRVFREMFRALRPGGRVALADVVTQGPIVEVPRAKAGDWNACLAGALDVAGYRAGLEAAGFIDVEVEPQGQFHAAGPQPPESTPFSALISALRPWPA